METSQLNFDGRQEYGAVKRADIHFNDWLKFCRGRRVVMATVKTKEGIYQADYRDPHPRPHDLWTVPPCEQLGEQLSVDGAPFD